MRAGSMQPVRDSGNLLLVAGGLLLALALGLLVYGSLGDDRSSPSAVQSSTLDPYAATNGTIAFWEARVHSDPQDFVAYNRLATAYIQRGRQTGDVGDYTRAQAAVDASLASVPNDNAGARGLLASLQLVRHDFAGALATARRTIALDPGDSYGYTVLGDAQLALGRYGEAYTTYNRLVNDYPGLPSFSRLAHILELRGDISSAELAWKNAVSTDGGRNAENTAWTHVQFGNFYFTRGDLDGAEGQYNQAAAALPDYVHALAGLARVQAAKGNYDVAIRLYTKVAQRQPLSEYVAALGDVYAAAGQPDATQKQYQLVLAINDLYKANNINTDLSMALFLADHDSQLDEALREARAVYTVQPDSIYSADALGWALYKSGDFNEAVGYARQALRLGAKDAALLFHAGMIEKALGDNDAARVHLGAVLSINPHFSVRYAGVAVQALAELEPGQ